MKDDECDAVSDLPKPRAKRRAYRRRAVARALRVARLFGIPPAYAHTWARHNADNLKMCSCWMCGHARKWYGTTLRETRRALSDDG